MNYPSISNNFFNEHVTLLNNSYRKLLDEELISVIHPYNNIAEALFYAPFVVVSHNIAIDPIFNYANLKALELFEFNWDEFTSLPSRLSAEPIHQIEREKLLSEVNRRGFLASYQGIRITKSSRKFMIKNAVVWDLLDHAGKYSGQAAKFEEWEFL